MENKDKCTGQCDCGVTHKQMAEIVMHTFEAARVKRQIIIDASVIRPICWTIVAVAFFGFSSLSSTF